MPQSIFVFSQVGMEAGATTSSGFIQARPSKIQGLFKDFSRTNLTIFKDLGWML